MPTTAPRPTEDVAAGATRMLRSLGRRIENGDPAELLHLVDLQAELQAALTACIYAQREHGHTDSDIAAALGITRQAVSKRWPGDGRYRGAAGRYRHAVTVAPVA